MSGLICFKHFRDEDIQKTKANKIIQLITGAIPIAQNIGATQPEEMFGKFEEPSSTSPASPSHYPSDVQDVQAVQAYDQCEQCYECSLKDLLIKQYECKIESLQKQLKSSQNTARYFKAEKTKLKEEISKNSINLELIRELEVGFIRN